MDAKTIKAVAAAKTILKLLEDHMADMTTKDLDKILNTTHVEVYERDMVRLSAEFLGKL